MAVHIPIHIAVTPTFTILMSVLSIFAVAFSWLVYIFAKVNIKEIISNKYETTVTPCRWFLDIRLFINFLMCGIFILISAMIFDQIIRQSIIYLVIAECIRSLVVVTIASEKFTIGIISELLCAIALITGYYVNYYVPISITDFAKMSPYFVVNIDHVIYQTFVGFYIDWVVTYLYTTSIVYVKFFRSIDTNAIRGLKHKNLNRLADREKAHCGSHIKGPVTVYSYTETTVDVVARYVYMIYVAIAIAVWSCQHISIEDGLMFDVTGIGFYVSILIGVIAITCNGKFIRK